MSSRLTPSYKPSSRLDRVSLMPESVQAESIYSETNYPLKKLSRYSNNRSPRHSQRNSHYQEPSIRSNTNHQSHKQSSRLNKAQYPESVRQSKNSNYKEQSYYTQGAGGHSTKQVRGYQQSEHRSKRSQYTERSRMGNNCESYISKQSLAKERNVENSNYTRESDYERFLRERYPDMVQSSQYSEKQEYSENPSYKEIKQVKFKNNYFKIQIKLVKVVK